MKDLLKQIIYETFPHSYRYPEARAMKRKFIFHAGPTNSGKTHKALERFQSAKSGIYCGPLRLLASEVYQKTNDNVRIIICMIMIYQIVHDLLPARGMRKVG